MKPMRHSVIAIAAFAAFAAACGSSGSRDADVGDQLCARLADRLEERVCVHEADLPVLRSWATTGGEHRIDVLLSPTLNDLWATDSQVKELGPACSAPSAAAPCARRVRPLEDVDDAVARLRMRLDGVRGTGPCAPDPAARRRATCHLIDDQLGVDADELSRVRDGWSTPVDGRGLFTKYALFAADTMARWRALLDYSLAVVPVCVPRAAATCAYLRDGLHDASPDELAARLRTLQAAFRDGAPCASAAVPPTP